MKRVLSVLMILLMVASLSFNNNSVKANTQYVPHELAPMDREAVVDKLVKDGKLSVNATQEEIAKALKNYMGNIVVKKEKNQYSKKREAILQKILEKGLKTAPVFNGELLEQTQDIIIEQTTKTSNKKPVKKVEATEVLDDSEDTKDSEDSKGAKNSKSDVDNKKQDNQDNKKGEVVQERPKKGLPTDSTYNGKRLGQSKESIIEQAEEIPYADIEKTVKVLVLLAEYDNFEHNNISEPEDLRNQYWTEDFDVEHYQNLLFGDGYYTTPEGTKCPTFKQYFKEQSSGCFDIEGDVFGWYKVPEDAEYYGEDIGGDGNDRAPRQLVVDVAQLAVDAGVDLGEYDFEDPYDLDGDGELMEPDGIVDHLMVIHAGAGQESGGGELGTDAIWSHSWSLNEPTEIVGTETKVFDYTTEPENGAVGVFAHEFVHDLGIPDDYDTIYSGDGAPVECWSIMDYGSYTGRPAGTMPTGINPWSRMLLGEIHGGDWISWEMAELNDFNAETVKQLDTASLYTGNTQAVVIELPEQNIYVNTPTEGTKEFFGGKAPEIDNSMTLELDLTDKTDVNLTYDIWYSIEENWDAGFVQVSVDDGVNWTSLETSNTVTFENIDGYPTIMDSLPGYTGSSNGWISESIDLSDYAGKKILVRFRYATDWNAELEGMYIDNVKVIAGEELIAFEGAEEGFGVFDNNGWKIVEGSSIAEHYYVAEWRSHLGLDEGLKYCGRAEIEYNQGLLLWYRNFAYDCNWMGVHPGYGYLCAVDANQYVYVNGGLRGAVGYIPFIQMHDAAFSLDRAEDMDLSVYSWALTTNLSSKQAEPVFDDSNDYYTWRSMYSGLKLPELGLRIRVTGNAQDYSRGEIVIYTGD